MDRNQGSIRAHGCRLGPARPRGAGEDPGPLKSQTQNPSHHGSSRLALFWPQRVHPSGFAHLIIQLTFIGHLLFTGHSAELETHRLFIKVAPALS